MNKKLFFLLSILSVFFIWNIKADTSLIGKTIIIDAGHGGLDPGTIYKNINEKDLNLKIALALKRDLILKGAKVIMTRSGDYDLAKPNAIWRKKSDFDNRIIIANNSNAVLFISIHLNNYKNPLYGGFQTFFKSNDNLANIIQKNINAKRKAKKIPPSTYMYNKIKIDTILLECGFLSNKTDRENLLKTTFRNKLAKKIADSLIDYYSN